MSNTPAPNIYESTFAPSDRTDAILVVDGKKLHVNKGLLSCHSDYFNALFNADFAEKSMPEIQIEDVKYEDFAALLSLVQHNPIVPTEANAEKLLELADRFLIPAANRHVELFLCTTQLERMKKLKLADKYKLEVLLQHTLMLFNEKEHFTSIYDDTLSFSDHTRSKLFQRFFSMFQKTFEPVAAPLIFGKQSFTAPTSSLFGN